MNRDPLTVDVVDLQPDGYCTTGEEKILVSGALPGECVEAVPFSRRRKKLFARTTDVLTASMDRVEPICSVASYCGGCSLQHMNPDKQIAYKHEQLVLAFDDCQPAEYLEPLRGPVAAYRGKARLGVKYVDKKEAVLVGFREKLSPFIAETTRCEILAAPMTGLLGPLAEMIAALSVRSALPQIEVGIGERRAALVFRHLQPLSEEDLERLLAFGEQYGIDLYLQPGGLDTTHKVFPLDGDDRLVYCLPEFDLEFRFHPLDFIQVNQVINQSLVPRALELLAVESSDVMLDLFCGIGNFTLPLARRTASVHGMESSETSVIRARENAAHNAISNCTFEVSDLFLAGLDLASFAANKVLLDPPRSGAEAVCKGLASTNAERVVYVSCNPQTLARDAKILVESGYRLDKAGVIDMFPHTTHVESIACFSR